MTSNDDLAKKVVDLEKRVKKLEEIANPSDHNADDQLLNQAIELVKQHDMASASLLQRRLAIGYARAARILDQLTERGVVSSSNGAAPRKVIQK